MMNVSIVIPVYNVAPYIEDCIRSVMRQTYKGSMECLIVDDCGTDDSMAIVERMITEYDGPIRFQILHHEDNRGLSAARNTGTMQATGAYLYYLDSDDEITNDCIEKLMEVVRRSPEVEMVQGNARRYPVLGEAYNIMKEIALPIAENNFEVRKCFFEKGQFVVYVWNKLLSRDFIIRNNIFFKEGIIHEDNLWTFYLLKYLKKASFLSDITYYYKKRQHSITTGADLKEKSCSHCLIANEILTHLTPNYACQELNYYVRIIGNIDLIYAYEMPLIKHVLELYRDNCKLYGGKPLYIKLLFLCFLVNFKHGWIVWAQLNRLRHPSLLCRDMKRIKTRFFPSRSYPALN